MLIPSSRRGACRPRGWGVASPKRPMTVVGRRLSRKSRRKGSPQSWPGIHLGNPVTRRDTIMRARIHPFSGITSLALAALLILSGPLVSAAKTMAMPDFTKGDVIPEGANHDWTLGATGAARVDVQRQARDRRSAADPNHEGGQELPGRRSSGGGGRDPGGGRQAVLVRPPHRDGQGAHRGRRRGQPRRLVADPLARRQDGDGRREVARPRRTARPPRTIARSRSAFSSKAARRWPNRSRPPPTGRTRSRAA